MSAAAEPQLEKSTKVVDLTQEIYQGMPVFPGHLNTVTWDYHTHENTVHVMESDLTYATRGIILSDHGPTHVDSLSHFDPRPDAATIDEMDLSLFWGSAICIDLSAAPPRTDIEPAQLEAALAASGQELKRGDIILITTGNWSRHAGTDAYLSQYPGLSEASAEWLVSRGVKAFGVDTPSPDNPASRIYPVHLVCRREGLHHYENLANLETVVGKRFTFAGLPLRLRGGHGSPVRAVALIDDDAA
jgi:kynurenine formamidase